MKWILATPYQRNPDDKNDLWEILKEQKTELELIYAPPHYEHDRSKTHTHIHEWIDYWLHSKIVWDRAVKDDCQAIITAFPQLAVCMGIRKRLSRNKIPVIAWSFNLGSIKNKIKGFFARLALKEVDVFIVPSSAEIKIYSQFLKQPSDRFKFVHYQKQLFDINETKDTNNPFIISMGAANRDYKILIEAVRNTKLPVTIVAPKRLVENLIIPKNVKVLSNLSAEECHSLAQKACFSVIPIKDPATVSGQITIIESMIFKTPIIVTSSLGALDYITPNQTGLLYEPGAVGELSSVMLRLWEDDSLRLQLAENAFQFVKTQLNGKKIALELYEIIGSFKTKSNPPD